MVYLIGFPGVGKLTVAKELAAKMNARIIDNHLINNPIFQLITIDHNTQIPQAVWYKIAEIREIVFSGIEDIVDPNMNLIFTNELLASSPQDIHVYDRIEQIAKKRHSTFIPVRLVCDVNELCKRVVSEGRAQKFKLTNPEVIKTKLKQETLYQPAYALTQTIDVTTLTPTQVADAIYKIIEKYTPTK